ncbi:hypothetical protein SUDANB145_05207 [Streptomyces sp. enrichment culture]|uniref:hypothetical protein n=1 Tax=Streptomyces sp. enrichment culture TaxID=1795815 RepID=UPI003F549E1E
MFLAAAGEGCEGGVDFLGMFGDPIGEMIKMVAKIIIRDAIEIFRAVQGIDSTNDAASQKISNQTQWLTVYLACGSILFAAGKMALDRRGEAGQTVLKGILRVILVSTATTALIGTFVSLMDRYSTFLLQGSLENLMGGINCNGGIPDMLLLVIGCLLIISGIIHALLMWIRLGVMIILMGTLPMAAAASMTDWGSTWWRKHIGWLTAWLLYKPTVGLVLYSGAVMIDSSEEHNPVDTQIAGMGLLLLSAIALPALLRLIVPATAALGGDAVGGATMGLAGGMASGARSLADSAGRSGDGGPSGAHSPSGSGGGSRPAEAAGGSVEGGGGSTGGASPSAGSAGGASTGAGKKATAANPALAAAVMAAEVAGKVAKGVADVAKSGVEDANRRDER